MFKGNSKLKKICLAGFFLYLHVALTSYINSSFLSPYFGEKFVGIIYTVASIITIIALALAPRILNKTGIRKFLLGIGVLDALALLSFSFIEGWSIALVFIVYFSLNNLIFFGMDEILEIVSKTENTGQIRGLYLTVANSAWVLAQLSTGSILGDFDFSFIYMVCFFVMCIFIALVFLKLRHIPDPSYDKINVFKSFKEFFRSKNLVRAYKMNFLLQFFFAWMVIYTPIYLSAHIGFGWKEIGVIFAIMLLPFVLLQFPLGKISDRIGERKMLMTGFAIASFATLSLFFIKAHSIWIWALALFATRVGAAIIEVMSDVYFFKHIKPENDQFVGVYRNTIPISYIVSPLCALIVLSLAPAFNFIFVILGALMLYGVYLASTIRKGDL